MRRATLAPRFALVASPARAKPASAPYAALDGGTPLVPRESASVESAYDSPGFPLSAQYLTPRGRLPDGTLVLGGGSVVWLLSTGAVGLSVPFDQRVARAGDGVAVAVFGFADATRAWVTGDGVFVPGTDAAGPFVVRVEAK